ncbi:MAG: CDP-diacylglycerol--glycerol-3-phosphate 3-phosphatidyltransferase [Lachnospiraceae bacterium]|nr:CDP-diacylglycerol--glycerol-3-phosphate 3-phosphatidyltransferase [Lachnospiraceae bacterium]
MNLPNKLTVLRVVLIPFFVVFLLTNCFGEASKWAALAIFIIASLTDMLDGKIARKYNLVTNFGKFMDPLADKMLVCSALICLTAMGKIPAWMVIVIVARDFTISGFRLVAAETGRVIAANYWGKFKTASQMVMICLVIADLQVGPLPLITLAFQYIAVILTIISLIVYLNDNKDVMKDAD